MKLTYYQKTKIEKRKTKSEKRKTKSEKRKAKNKKNLVFDQMNVCIWHELFDWRNTLTHFLKHSLTQTLFMYADNSYNMTQPYDRNAKSKKRKAKSEKRKAKSKKNLDFDEMNVYLWHELFD